MKPEKQRIKIAEACGFSNPYHRTFVMGPDILSDGETGDPIPDYLNDLNAMHEAEKVLGDKWMRYSRKLLEITTGCGDNKPLGFLNGGTLCSAVHATAAQRAEAFLKTLGLWEEEQV